MTNKDNQWLVEAISEGLVLKYEDEMSTIEKHPRCSKQHYEKMTEILGFKVKPPRRISKKGLAAILLAAALLLTGCAVFRNEIRDFIIEIYETFVNVSFNSGKDEKVITAPSSVDASLTQQNYSVSDNQLWKITKVNGTMYKLSPKSNLSYYMAAGDGIFTSDGRNIEMRRAQSDNKDEWVFVRMYDSTFVAIPEGTGHPHEASFIDIATSLNRRGHVWNRVATSVTATDCISYMTSSKIFYSRSHGGKTSIVLNNESLTVSILDALPTGALSFCDLVLYGACSTAEGEAAAINLVNKTNEKGVRCVIGFSTSVYCEEVNIWATAFFDALTNGKTVEAACYSADEVVERTWNHDISTNTWYIAGANSLILNWGGLS